MESPSADVLIETIRTDAAGQAALWPYHEARLTHSAHALGFAAVPAGLTDRIRSAVAACPPHPDFRVRLLFTRQGEATCEAHPLGALAVPAKLAIATRVLGPCAVLNPQEPLLRHKATYRPWYDAATAWLAQHPDCFDLLFENEHGALCEGSRTNVYVLRDGQWLTPDTSAGCLPGTQRAALLASGRVRVASLTLADLPHAQGLRLSNALRGWFDVRLADYSR